VSWETAGYPILDRNRGCLLRGLGLVSVNSERQSGDRKDEDLDLPIKGEPGEEQRKRREREDSGGAPPFLLLCHQADPGDVFAQSLVATSAGSRRLAVVHEQ
jgi:hypothetical protein